MLDNWFVIAGLIASVVGVLSGMGALVRGMWKLARQLVRFADALPALLRLADQADTLAKSEDLRSHTQDDAAFQTWIVRALDRLDGNERPEDFKMKERSE